MEQEECMPIIKNFIGLMAISFDSLFVCKMLFDDEKNDLKASGWSEQGEAMNPDIL